MIQFTINALQFLQFITYILISKYVGICLFRQFGTECEYYRIKLNKNNEY